MSRSPSAPPESSAAGEAERAYGAGWAAINRLIRQGWSWSGHERNVAFLNVGDGVARFADVSAVAGLDEPDDSRAVVRVDWDFDGDLDLIVTGRTGPRARVLRNDLAPGNHWLSILLAGRPPNTGAIGARVEIEVEGGARTLLAATRRAGEGYLAQSSAWLHFGLGAGTVREVRVRWPGGAVESFGAPRADRHVILAEGAGRAREFTAPSVPALAARRLAEPPPSATARIVTAAPVPMPTLEARSDGRRSRFLGIGPGGPRGTRQPLLLMLVSHTCAPCAVELARFAAARDALAAAGVELVVLAVDPEEEAEEVRAFAGRTGVAATVAFGAPETLATLDALVAALRDDYEALRVPASFLVDAQGFLHVVYVGAAEPDRVVADLALFGLDPEARRAAALPFPGRFVNPARPLDLDWLEAAFERRGLPAVAAEVSLAKVEAREVGEAEMQVDFGKARLTQERYDDAERHFARAVELDPSSVDGWKGLGYCRHRRGELEPAREAYERAERLAPDDDRNRANLALVLVDLGELDAARAELAELRRRGSELAEMVAERLGR